MRAGPARIRLAEPRDGDAIAEIYRPFVTDSATSFEIDPPDGDEIRRRIEKTLARYPWLVAEQDTHIVGYAYAGTLRERAAYQWSAEVSVYVAADAHGSGIGRRLYESLFALLVRQGFVNVFAGMTVPNAASDGFHRAMGFEPVGVYRRIGYKFGRWHDTAWFGKALRTPPADVAPPIPLSELGDREVINASLE